MSSHASYDRKVGGVLTQTEKSKRQGGQRLRLRDASGSPGKLS